MLIKSGKKQNLNDKFIFIPAIPASAARSRLTSSVFSVEMPVNRDRARVAEQPNSANSEIRLATNLRTDTVALPREKNSLERKVENGGRC
jgi:hypothetical protein